MQNIKSNHADGAIREGEPPLVQNATHMPHDYMPPMAWHRLLWLWPAALGCLLLSWAAMIVGPCSWWESILVFAVIAAGPFGPRILIEGDMGNSSFAIFQALGILSILLIVAYPTRPSVNTTIASVIGLTFWLWAGFFSLISLP